MKWEMENHERRTYLERDDDDEESYSPQNPNEI